MRTRTSPLPGGSALPPRASLEPHLDGRVESSAERESLFQSLPISILAVCFSYLDLRSLVRVRQTCSRFREAVNASLPLRTDFNFSGLKATDEQVLHMVMCARHCVELDLWCSKVTRSCFYQLAQAEMCRQLVKLSLWGVSSASDETLGQLLPHCSQLRCLNLGGTFVGDTTVQRLPQWCPMLRTLVLHNCRCLVQITESLSVAVKHLPYLNELFIWGADVGLHTHAALLELNPSLRIR
mmetsp:Transcript_9916/g.36275  ORF Transcript_9916/g.36275 Transcript_9916/m.36275 type:complete len:239 (+) Transcript_9916:34-750(+)